MIRALLVLVAAIVAAPLTAQSTFTYKNDPFDSCATIGNNAPVRLTVYKCDGYGEPDHVSVLTTFNLGTSSLAPSRFMLRGGIELELLDRPYATLTTCNRGWTCNYISTATFYVPFDVLFSEEALKSGLQIKVFGMIREEFITISSADISSLRTALVTYSFIKG